jgi:glutamine amidotransferase
MRRLDRFGLLPVLRGLEQPVLGICLGMQLLFEHSDEGDTPCLGILPGSVRAIEPNPAAGVTVPHMGWNTIERTGDGSRLFDVVDRTYMYFVHSYCAPAGPSTRATTDHGGSVVAAVERGNFFGVQFHPERSADAGARLLEGFAAL